MFFLCQASPYPKKVPFTSIFLHNYISVIPKKEETIRFRDFTPISLCNVSYTIFSNIITNRLGTLLLLFISREQGAFSKNRLITENIGLAQKLVQSIRTDTFEGNIILKLDMEKPSDRME